MLALNRWIRALFSIIFPLCKCVHSFTGAPGFLTLKVQTPQFVEDCIQKNCKYDLEICIGSGRSSDEKCLLSQYRDFNKTVDMNKKYLTEIVFQVDDVQSSFYFNANISYVQRNNISKTKRFRDVMFKYSENQTLYSTDFTNLTLEISIKCKPGFYPKLKCTVPCFDNPPIYKCNELGEKICLKEELKRNSGESNCINPIEENQDQSFGIGFAPIIIIVGVIIVILATIACVIKILCRHKTRMPVLCEPKTNDIMSHGIPVHWTQTSNDCVGANHLDTHLDNDYDYSNNCVNNYDGSNNWGNKYGRSNNWGNKYGRSNLWNNIYWGSNNWDIIYGGSSNWDNIHDDSSNWINIYGDSNNWINIHGDSNNWDDNYGDSNNWDDNYGDSNNWDNNYMPNSNV